MEQGAVYKASCCLRFIKAIFPLLLYDGEPSVPNEIASQLPSSHLFIHRVPTKLSNGILSHGENYRWLQLLFFRSYRPASPSAVPVARWTLCLPWFPLVLLLMRLPKAPSFTGSFPEPCPAPVNIGNPARLWNHLHISAIVRNAAVSSACFSCRRMSLSILPKSYFVLSPRIVKIIRSILQAITISDCIFLSGFPPWLCNTGAVP